MNNLTYILKLLLQKSKLKEFHVVLKEALSLAQEDKTREAEALLRTKKLWSFVNKQLQKFTKQKTLFLNKLETMKQHCDAQGKVALGIAKLNIFNNAFEEAKYILNISGLWGKFKQEEVI